ncbi:hypothetical protein NX059_011689 [Plenodomus lindquistii]|nr:hypothetical protein NX059_011689 [Plenodomus lindquistii]
MSYTRRLVRTTPNFMVASPRCRTPAVVKSRISFAYTTQSPPTRSTASHNELFEYTSGRWLLLHIWPTTRNLLLTQRRSWNNVKKKHADKWRVFHFSEFNLAAETVGQKAENMNSLGKLGEGGFNRALLITM